MKNMAYEEYGLVLTHTYVDGNGERTVLEDPVKVVRVFPVEGNRMILPVAVCINDMMDCMKDYILRKVGERGEQDDYERKDISLDTDDIFDAELAKRILNNK